ncbi:hypothetical protein OKW35_001152 [Paraburkholderia sp. MM5477-R1]
MVSKTRQAIRESHDRAADMFAIIAKQDTCCVTVNRAELCRLLTDHAVICSIALDPLSREEDPQERP